MRNAIEAGKILGRKSWDAKSWDECVREEPEMSERAREFLQHWVSDHVGAVADEYRMRETVRLVALCREDAIRAGIPPDELRTAAGGNLIQCMLAVLSAAAARTKQTADLD
jgi:aspartate oxidase